MQKANNWEPNDPFILTTLGMARYRTGAYEPGLNALTTAAKLRADKGAPADLTCTAFTAMTLHQLGRDEAAQSSLERLRALLQDERFANDGWAKALVAEAEKLIGSKKP